ncbi:MAG: hypothetical protein Q9162_004932 [Coniocarpon cinnabarinum]
MLIPRRWLSLLAVLALFVIWYIHSSNESIIAQYVSIGRGRPLFSSKDGSPYAARPAKGADFQWSTVVQHYPVSSIVPLPTGYASSLPRIQHAFHQESPEVRRVRLQRLEAVRSNFSHSWHGYKEFAWGKDEVGPLSAGSYDHFGGWAATLVDSLDTLWIMGFEKDFDDAMERVEKIDFSTCALQQLNVFETVIRYMGGLLGAYDLTEGKYSTLLDKAIELGEMVYKAFDTPNRMPITRWDFQAAKAGEKQHAPDMMLIAELGSLNLELTHLAQLTRDDKYYDAVKRITDHLQEQQQQTLIPGLFPIQVDPLNLEFRRGNLFTLGGMVDSLYEYMPKMHLLLNGATDQYEKLYNNAMIPVKKHLVFRPMTTDSSDVRLIGQAALDFDGKIVLDPRAQHLTCFVGGMVGLGSRVFSKPGDIELARQLTEGCAWAYDVMPRGIMPEIMHAAYCKDEKRVCKFDEKIWHQEVVAWTNDAQPSVEEKIQFNHLPKGVSAIDDTRYGLRPEAIESVFVLYRMTGDQSLQDQAWKMFESIVRETKTAIGAAALSDCITPGVDGRTDRMESFWFAETLKYFYLVFSEPDVVSLDEFVLNTEAHPFRYRPAVSE